MQLTSGTRALVTGASRGIGRALAASLAARGAVVGLAARSAGELEALAATLPGTHHVLPCDVADRDAMREAVAAFIERAGGLDLLVANAGITHYGPFAQQSAEKVDAMTQVNWQGTINTVQAGLPHLLDRGHGHVVVVSSGAALRSFPGAAVYGATKAAQRMFAEALRHELSGTGVSLTTVYPGEISSSLHDHEKETMPSWYRGGPDAAPAEKMAAAVLKGIESDARAVHYPKAVQLLGKLHGLSPRLSDRVLHRLRGASAAPRLD